MADEKNKTSKAKLPRKPKAKKWKSWKDRYMEVLRPLEEKVLWWSQLFEMNAVPTKPLKPLREKDLEPPPEQKKNPIIMSAEEYLGGVPKRFDSYHTLENEMFPDMFKEAYENDVASLYEAIASSKSAGLYSNLMTGALMQKEREQKKKNAEQKLATSKSPNKESLASYMVDIVTKFMLASKEEKVADKKKKSGTKQTKAVEKPQKSIVKRKTKKDSDNEE